MNAVKPHDYKNRVAASFGAKVANYAEHALIQRKLLEKVCSQVVSSIPDADSLWLDLGCGDGALERMLARDNESFTMIGLDIARESLRYCASHTTTHGTRWIQADLDTLPFKSKTFNGIVAASVLQWSLHPKKTLTRIPELLIDGGIVVFSLFVEGAFHELAEMRRQNNLPPAILLPRPDEISRSLYAGGCTSVFFEHFNETIYFPSSRALLRHLGAIGSTSAQSHMSRTTLNRFCTDFDACFGTDRGVPLSYAAIIGFAEKGGSHD